MPKRATGQLCSDFSENVDYLILKSRVKLSGRRTFIVETYIQFEKKKHENIVLRDCPNSKDFGVEVPK